MAESKNKSRPKAFGRILDYQEASPEEKVMDFKKRLQEQIAVIQVGIKSGDVTDPRKAQNYIRKIEQFLSIDFFTSKKNKEKRVHHLKQYCKVVVASDKEIIAILKEWICQKRSYKINAFNAILERKDEHAFFTFLSEMATFYERDNGLLGNVKAKYESELILLNRIKGLIADKSFFESIGGTKLLKVEAFKEKLLDWAQDYPFEVEIELEDIFKLPYFRYKKYLQMNMGDFKAFLDVRTTALQSIIDWAEEQISINIGAFKNLENQPEAVSKLGEADYLAEYDQSLTALNKLLEYYEKEYKLYRFGQGLMEADIFDTLYK